MTLYLAPLVCLVGLVMWCLASGKAGAVGQVMFACGLLVTLFKFAPAILHLP